MSAPDAPTLIDAGRAAPTRWPDGFAPLLAALDALHADMVRGEADLFRVAPAVAPEHRDAARNLAHYLAARRLDLRPLQDALSRLGLSSLGRMEGHAMATVRAVRRAVAALGGDVGGSGTAEVAASLGAHDVTARVEVAAAALFGPRPPRRSTRVMVTLPSEAADAPTLVDDLVAGGMSVARINCAHDDAEAWARMAAHVRAASVARPVRVLMDLAGPKLRTGALEAGPRVVHWGPRRDERGAPLAPVRVAITPTGVVSSGERCDVVLPAPPGWIATLREGDTIETVDARGRERSLGVVRAGGGTALALSFQTAWIEDGAPLRRRGPDGTAHEVGAVGPVPAMASTLRLHRGDRLVLTRDPAPGRDAPRDEEGRAAGPATIPCTLPEAFACVRAGQSVWFDDGKIGGRVVAVAPDALEVVIEHARPDGSTLGADKGINLPDTRFAFPGLTAKDHEDLHLALEHADLVGLSFVDDPDDVRDLWRALRARPDRAGPRGGPGGGPRGGMGAVVKIETRHAFERLPEVLLAAMEGYPVGVMIARGDLAVECGFERLAEVQEEILWMAEAAHVPVVWATQVLESATKKGRPTRAEITDAAMGVRAECVMLNKGPHVRVALRVLDDVLCRMEAHQHKKTALLRPLSISAGPR